MTSGVISCPKCFSEMPPEDCNTSHPVPCKSCEHLIWIHVFPAFFRPSAPIVVPQPVEGQTASSCFYHPDKQSVQICSLCGRFICSLCDLDLNNEHLCPNCLTVAGEKGKVASLVTKRHRWDLLTLGLAIIPPLLIVTLYFVPLTALAAIAFGIRYWKENAKYGRGAKIRMGLGIGIAVLELVLLAIGAMVLFLK